MGDRIFKLDDFLIPEFRQWYREQIEEKVRKDTLTFELRDFCLLNSRKNLILAQAVLQLVPSLSEGLSYAIILKELSP
jgi:hypothetical protein